MGLADVKKELEEQLEEALKREETDPILDEGDSLPEQPKEELKAEEVKPEVVEAPKEEPKVEEDKGPARLRREAAAAAKRAEAAEARAAAAEEKLQNRTEVETPTNIPDPVAQELQEFMQERTMTKAEREFLALESQFKQSAPDYDQVAAAYQREIYKGIYANNPRKSPEEVMEMTKITIMNKAGEYARGGFNAVEELYHDGKEIVKKFGISFEKPEEKPEPKEDPRPDMAKVAANRARNAGMAAAQGQGAQVLTRQAAAAMSPAEWKALPRSEREKMLRNA